MKAAKVLAFLGLLAMTGILAFAFTSGDFFKEGSALLAMPWGIVSLVDLYVGFSLFSGWIIYREKSPWQAALWVILMMTLGFFTASLYVLVALQKSGGSWNIFWHGHRAAAPKG